MSRCSSGRYPLPSYVCVFATQVVVRRGRNGNEESIGGLVVEAGSSVCLSPPGWSTSAARCSKSAQTAMLFIAAGCGPWMGAAFARSAALGAPFFSAQSGVRQERASRCSWMARLPRRGRGFLCTASSRLRLQAVSASDLRVGTLEVWLHVLSFCSRRWWYQQEGSVGVV